jgi:hypothetical protein
MLFRKYIYSFATFMLLLPVSLYRPWGLIIFAAMVLFLVKYTIPYGKQREMPRTSTISLVALISAGVLLQAFALNTQFHLLSLELARTFSIGGIVFLSLGVMCSIGLIRGWDMNGSSR